MFIILVTYKLWCWLGVYTRVTETKIIAIIAWGIYVLHQPPDYKGGA